MSTKLPLDVNDNPIPALRLKENGAHVVASANVSTRNAVAFDDATRVVSVYATAPVFINFGDSGVSADNDDHYFPAGLYYDIALGGDGAPHYSHIAVLALADAGSVYVSEKA